MARKVEEVFVTEGVPQETFVEPPNYGNVLVDVRHPKKPVVIEGQSGTGKTTTVRKIIARLENGHEAKYLSPRNPDHMEKIVSLATHPGPGIFIVDDFHRLNEDIREQLGNIAKIAAETPEDNLPKIILIGINQVGSGLIQFVPDIAKRVGIHKISPASKPRTLELIQAGCESLNITIENSDVIYEESQGDYWLTQLLCQSACTGAGIYEVISGAKKSIIADRGTLRSRIVDRLHAAYSEAVKEFCRGRRFRPSNDPYFKLLKAVAEHGAQTGDSNVDLTMLANSRADVRQSINNVKDHRLGILLTDKPQAARYFYYNEETKQFCIEDPAVFYYIKHLNWDRLRTECGFRADDGKTFDYDVAISFAAPSRELARYLADQLEQLDVKVFYDENYETNLLGKSLSREFERIFKDASRFVVCLLDGAHRERVWPTFERDCFVPRVSDECVLPVYLDNTNFPGLSGKDLKGIFYKFDAGTSDWQQRADKEIIYPLIDWIG